MALIPRTVYSLSSINSYSGYAGPCQSDFPLEMLTAWTRSLMQLSALAWTSEHSRWHELNEVRTLNICNEGKMPFPPPSLFSLLDNISQPILT